MGRISPSPAPKNRATCCARSSRIADPEDGVGNKASRGSRMRRSKLGMCRVRANPRGPNTGELGWELQSPRSRMQNLPLGSADAAAEKHGMKLIGARAAKNWLRQEKELSLSRLRTEHGRDATPLEAGLDRFVDLDKDFTASRRMLRPASRSKCVTLLIDGAGGCPDPWGREALVSRGNEKGSGRLTSGGLVVRPSASRSGWATCGRTSPRWGPSSSSACSVSLRGAGCRRQPLRPAERRDPQGTGEPPALQGLARVFGPRVRDRPRGASRRLGRIVRSQEIAEHLVFRVPVAQLEEQLCAATRRENPAPFQARRAHAAGSSAFIPPVRRPPCPTSRLRITVEITPGARGRALAEGHQPSASAGRPRPGRLA